MKKYHKINGLYKRHREGDKRGQFIIGDFSTPEFEYLFHNQWVGTEKIDGTNIRIHWNGNEVKIGGRTDNSQIPVFLYDKLQKMISIFNWNEVFPDAVDVTLYGEGYGAKIQKGGLYISDGVDFILFDVKIDKWWMKREVVNDIASKLNIDSVPVIFNGTLEEGIEFVKDEFKSTIGTAKAEGLVLVPEIDLLDRNGERIITKLKTIDFK